MTHTLKAALLAVTALTSVPAMAQEVRAVPVPPITT
jgi:hypothetical protein